MGIFLLNGLAQADVTLNVTDKGLPVGTIRWSVRANKGGRTDHQTIAMGNGPKKEIDWRWNPKGEPIRIEMSMASTSIVNGKVSKGRTVIVTDFPTDKPPKTTIRVPGRTLRPDTAQPGEPNTDPSAFWFVRDHPKPGDSVSFAAFDILNLRWEHVDRTFVGRQSAPGIVGEFNVVRESRDLVESTLYLDDSGEPVLIISGDIRMVRQ